MSFSVLDTLGRVKQFSVPSVFTTTTTGNIDDLDFANADLIRMNNATLATIRGLVAGYDGQVVTIVSIGAGNVNLANQNANSAANNRQILFVTSADTPLAAGHGTATLQYDATTLRWRLVAHEQGARLTAAFSAGNFTGAVSQTWTVEAGDVESMSYVLRGNTLDVLISLATTTIGGTPSSGLLISNAAWGGFSTSVGFINMIGPVNQGGVTTNGSFAIGTVGSLTTSIRINKNFDGDNYAASTNATSVRGAIAFPVD